MRLLMVGSATKWVFGTDWGLDRIEEIQQLLIHFRQASSSSASSASPGRREWALACLAGTWCVAMQCSYQQQPALQGCASTAVVPATLTCLQPERQPADHAAHG